MERGIARNWWMLALRGGLALAFGVCVFFWPGLAWIVVVVLFAAYALLDGVLAMAAALTGQGRDGRSWWALVLEGVVGIGAGVLALFWPQITALVLLYLIGFWAVFTGVLEVAVAIRLRKEIEGEWALGAAGVLSVVFGLVILFAPSAGALAVAWIIGAYAILFGVLLLTVAFQLRGRARGGVSPGSVV